MDLLDMPAREPLGHFLPSQLLTRVQEIVAPSAHGTVEGWPHHAAADPESDCHSVTLRTPCTWPSGHTQLNAGMTPTASPRGVVWRSRSLRPSAPLQA